jgi:outer membrane protein OmpA-like peptidoglycan-associated protein
LKPGQPLQADERRFARERRKVKDHAFNSTPGSSHRGGCSFVAGESLHSHAGIHQVDFERCCGHCRSSVAAERFWIVPLPFPDPRRNVSDAVKETGLEGLKALTQDSDTRQYGRHLPQGDTLKNTLLLVAGIALSLSAVAQTTSQPSLTVEPMSPTPTFRVNVISRSVQAVNYRHRSGATKLDFAGTNLMTLANGEAQVNSKRGAIEIEAEFGDLEKPTTFGNEYLTYILWAISPEGRAVNLGEVLLGGNHRSKLHVTTDLQAFALIVTAEPYYAVRQPSNVVVLENVVREDTKGTTEAVNAKYELMERGGYIPTGYKFDPVVLNAKLPLEFFEARNALRIAQSEGSEQYAAESYQRAVQLMNHADEYATRKHIDKKPLIAISREAVQTAEDARAIAVKQMDEVRLANERQDSSDAQAKSQEQADDATRLKEQAQSDAAKAQAAKAQAESDAINAQAARAQAESDATKARADAADAQAATAKAKSDMADSQASSAAALSATQADADQSRLAAQQAQLSAQQAETEKAAMRTKLSDQLNRILQTRDSARGLIVSMSDVLFDTGKYSLKPGAREKLAKVAGILLAYPGLNIEVGGYTDNVGGDAMNQTLSENRAGSVRDYLVREGVSTNSVSSRGFGNTLPVASNDNSAGRQQNRRVELLVSGEAIGSPVNATTGSLR